MSLVSFAVFGLECGAVRISLTRFVDFSPRTKCPQIINASPSAPQDDVLRLAFGDETPICSSKDHGSSEWSIVRSQQARQIWLEDSKCEACPQCSRLQARPHINDRPACSFVPTSGAEGVCGARRVQPGAGQRLALDEVGCGIRQRRRSSSSAGRSLRRGDGVPHNHQNTPSASPCERDGVVSHANKRQTHRGKVKMKP